MSKNCIVSFASNGRNDYRKWLLNLLDSCVEHWGGDYLIYSPDHWLNNYKGIEIKNVTPTNVNYFPFYEHSEMPYQFKIAIIEQARQMGYEKITWLDTSLRLLKNPIHLFKEKGVTVFHNLGHPLYKYISDDAVEKLGITESALMGIQQIWCGLLFFDFTHNNAVDVFNKIKEFSINGSFKDGISKRDGFVAHRHDQAVMSVLVSGKCDMLPYGVVAAKNDITEETYIQYGN